MSDKNTPAFPVLIVDRPEELLHFNGMSLRDYFAAKAMPVIAAEVYSWKERLDAPIPKITAKMAYEFADEMMKARAE